MRTILISGATGFIGRHVVNALKASTKNCRLIAAGRDERRLKALGIDYVVFDICGELRNGYNLLGQPDVMIHLAWDGLPNYQKLYHIERNMVSHYRFLKKMIRDGLKCVTVAGTCFEYGFQNGCLKEADPTVPRTIYGIAKDSLRRKLEALHGSYTFKLKWLRLFYTYGPGQMKTSLLAQLEEAIDKGDAVFNMSPGDQLRDYMPVVDMAQVIVRIATEPTYTGVCNVCSGNPISIAQLVEGEIHRRDSPIRVNRGYYPYCDYEPMAFWGDTSRMNYLLKMASDAENPSVS